MMNVQKNPLAHGDIVVCRENCIDRAMGKGLTGRVTGFARLSAYHPREVMVEGIGWLWDRDVQRVDA